MTSSVVRVTTGRATVIDVGPAETRRRGRRRTPQRPARSTGARRRRTEVAAAQLVQRRVRRGRQRQLGVGLDPAVGGGVDVDAGAVRREHAVHRPGHPVLVHPVEGLGEGDQPERAQVRRQVLGVQLPPFDVGHARRPGQPVGLPQHAGVGVDADRRREPVGQQQGQRAGAAADVQQPTGAVEVQLGGDPVGQLGRVGHPADDVVRGGAGVQVRVAVLGHGSTGPLRHAPILATRPVAARTGFRHPIWQHRGYGCRRHRGRRRARRPGRHRTSWPARTGRCCCSTASRSSRSAARRSGPWAGCSASTPPSSGGCGSGTRPSWPWPTGWAAPRSTGRRTTGRAAGPRRTCSSRPASSGPGCTSSGCAGSRWCSGPSAAATPPPATATRCPASTSPGAPGPAWCEPFAQRVLQSRKVRIRARHRVTAIEAGADGVQLSGEVLEGCELPRGVRSPDAVVGEFSLSAPAVVVASGGIGGNFDLVRQNWPAGWGDPPRDLVAGVPDYVDGAAAAGHRAGRGAGDQPGPDVALPGGDQEPLPDLEPPRHPDPAGPVVAVAGRPRQPLPGAPVPRLRRPGGAAPGHRERVRVLLVRAGRRDAGQGVRPVRLGAERRPDRQGPAAAGRPGPPRSHAGGAGVPRARRGLRHRRLGARAGGADEPAGR